MNRTRVLVTAIGTVILCLGCLIAYKVLGSQWHTTQANVIISGDANNTAANAEATLLQQPNSTPYTSRASRTVATTVVPPIRPYPTDMPTAHTLADIAQVSNGIAEVEVTSASEWGFVARVEKWLKPISLFSDQVPSDSVNPPYVDVYLPENEMKLMRSGGHYVILLQVSDPYNWCQPLDYNITFGSEGLYEIKDGKVAYAGLNGYSGISAIQLEADMLQKVSSSVQAQSAVLPDSGQNDLIQIVHSSDLIVEANQISGEGSTGGVFLGFSMGKVLKGPSNSALLDTVQDGKIILRYMDCSNIPTEAGSRYILFLQASDKSSSPDSVTGLGYFGVTNENVITRGGFTHPLGGKGIRDSLNHYAGWPLSKVEAAISNALQAPYTPEPIATKAHP